MSCTCYIPEICESSFILSFAVSFAILKIYFTTSGQKFLFAKFIYQRQLSTQLAQEQSCQDQKSSLPFAKNSCLLMNVSYLCSISYVLSNVHLLQEGDYSCHLLEQEVLEKRKIVWFADVSQTTQEKQCNRLSVWVRFGFRRPGFKHRLCWFLVPLLSYLISLCLQLLISKVDDTKQLKNV